MKNYFFKSFLIFLFFGSLQAMQKDTLSFIDQAAVHAHILRCENAYRAHPELRDDGHAGTLAQRALDTAKSNPWQSFQDYVHALCVETSGNKIPEEIKRKYGPLMTLQKAKKEENGLELLCAAQHLGSDDAYKILCNHYMGRLDCKKAEPIFFLSSTPISLWQIGRINSDYMDYGAKARHFLLQAGLKGVSRAFSDAGHLSLATARKWLSIGDEYEVRRCIDEAYWAFTVAYRHNYDVAIYDLVRFHESSFQEFGLKIPYENKKKVYEKALVFGFHLHEEFAQFMQTECPDGCQELLKNVSTQLLINSLVARHINRLKETENLIASAQVDCSHACTHLAYMHYLGLEVEKSNDNALYWCSRARIYANEEQTRNIEQLIDRMCQEGSTEACADKLFYLMEHDEIARVIQFLNENLLIVKQGNFLPTLHDNLYSYINSYKLNHLNKLLKRDNPAARYVLAHVLLKEKVSEANLSNQEDRVMLNKALGLLYQAYVRGVRCEMYIHTLAQRLIEWYCAQGELKKVCQILDYKIRLGDCNALERCVVLCFENTEFINYNNLILIKKMRILAEQGNFKARAIIVYTLLRNNCEHNISQAYQHFLQLGQVKGAMSWFCCHASPRDIESLQKKALTCTMASHILGTLLYKTGQYEDALKIFSDEKMSTHPWALYYSARIHQFGRCACSSEQRALKLYKELLNCTEPKLQQHALQIMNVYAQKGNSFAQFAVLCHAIRNGNVGEINHYSSLLGTNVEQFVSYIQKDDYILLQKGSSQSAPCARLCAQILSFQGNYQEAYKFSLALIVLDCSLDQNDWYTIALAAYKAEDFTGSLQWLKKIDRPTPASLWLHGLCFLRQNQIEQGTDLCSQAVFSADQHESLIDQEWLHHVLEPLQASSPHACGFLVRLYLKDRSRIPTLDNNQARAMLKFAAIDENRSAQSLLAHCHAHGVLVDQSLQASLDQCNTLIQANIQDWVKQEILSTLYAIAGQLDVVHQSRCLNETVACLTACYTLLRLEKSENIAKVFRYLGPAEKIVMSSSTLFSHLSALVDSSHVDGLITACAGENNLIAAAFSCVYMLGRYKNRYISAQSLICKMERFLEIVKCSDVESMNTQERQLIASAYNACVDIACNILGNPQRAVELAEKAHLLFPESNDILCNQALLLIHMHSQGAYSKGMNILNDLAKSGHLNACLTLGKMYIKGTSLCKQNISKGLNYLETAIVGGSPQSCLFLYAHHNEINKTMLVPFLKHVRSLKNSHTQIPIMKFLFEAMSAQLNQDSCRELETLCRWLELYRQAPVVMLNPLYIQIECRVITLTIVLGQHQMASLCLLRLAREMHGQIVDPQVRIPFLQALETLRHIKDFQVARAIEEIDSLLSHSKPASSSWGSSCTVC